MHLSLFLTENCVAPPWCISSQICTCLLCICLHICWSLFDRENYVAPHAAHHDFTHTRCAHDSRLGRQRLNAILPEMLSCFRKQDLDLAFVGFCWYLTRLTSTTLTISLCYYQRILWRKRVICSNLLFWSWIHVPFAVSPASLFVSIGLLLRRHSLACFTGVRYNYLCQKRVWRGAPYNCLCQKRHKYMKRDLCTWIANCMAPPWGTPGCGVTTLGAHVMNEKIRERIHLFLLCIFFDVRKRTSLHIYIGLFRQKEICVTALGAHVMKEKMRERIQSYMFLLCISCDVREPTSLHMYTCLFWQGKLYGAPVRHTRMQQRIFTSLVWASLNVCKRRSLYSCTWI